MTPQVRNYLPAEDLAKLFGTSVTNIYRLASQNVWRKVRIGRRMYYHLDDADRDVGEMTGFDQASKVNGS